MRIILFRHGEHKNDKLTSTGKQNVKSIGEQLKGFNIKKIYTSPTGRCVESAKILSKLLGVADIKIKAELYERFQLNHMPTNSDEQEWWDNYMNLDYKPQKNKVGETCNEYISRNNKLFKEILKSTDKVEDILIVAHSSTSYALTNFIWKTKKLQWMKLGNANFLVFEVL